MFNELRVFLQVRKLSDGNFTCKQATFPEIQPLSIYSFVLFTVYAISFSLKASFHSFPHARSLESGCASNKAFNFFFLVKNCSIASLVMSGHVQLEQDHHLGYDLVFVVAGVLIYDSNH